VNVRRSPLPTCNAGPEDDGQEVPPGKWRSLPATGTGAQLPHRSLVLELAPPVFRHPWSEVLTYLRSSFARPATRGLVLRSCPTGILR
jgi:hypothetical protein